MYKIRKLLRLALFTTEGAPLRDIPTGPSPVRLLLLEGEAGA